jgi:voltage-gated potassium channel
MRASRHVAQSGRLHRVRLGRPIRRAQDRFASDPASVKNAAFLMIAITAVIVLVGGLVVWVFDRQDFPDLGGALWYTLQTVTTVGYGDKVPTSGVGRVVGAIVMVVAVALIAILTASITSTFVEAAQRRRRAADEVHDRASAEALQQGLDDVVARLAAIEAILQAPAPGPGATAPPENRS